MNLSNSSASVRSIVWRPVLLQMKATRGRRRASGKGLTVFQPEPRPFHLSRNCQSDRIVRIQHFWKMCVTHIFNITIKRYVIFLFIKIIRLVKCSPHVFTTKNSEFSRIFGLDTYPLYWVSLLVLVDNVVIAWPPDGMKMSDLVKNS